ncbi:MAG: hypothetical protein AAGC74_01415 [Verrucomicrobiota bacterium]
MRVWLVLLLAVLGLASCARIGGLVSSVLPEEEADEEFGQVPEVPAHLAAGGAATARVEPTLVREVEAGVDPATLTAEQGGIAGLPTEEEMMWTDPDAPEASEDLLKELGVERDGVWQLSHSMARRDSMTKGKSLLIWFAHSSGERKPGSPASLAIERELFARPKFGEWAEQNLVRMKTDRMVPDARSVDPKAKEVARQKEKYHEKLKKRYSVRGYPTLVVVAPDGSVVSKVRGYRAGDPEYTWGLLRTAVDLAEKRQATFEEKLKKKGYRYWEGGNERRILARLASYRDGRLLLIGPDGVRYQTHERSLSKADRDWIADERERRLSGS